MNHPPKQLALLISLIGAGVSPYAYAQSDDTLPSLACTEADLIALPVCGELAERGGWTTPAEVSEPGPSLQVRDSVAKEDWAPGEVEGSEAPDSPVVVASTPAPVRLAVSRRPVARAPKPVAVRAEPVAVSAIAAQSVAETASAPAPGDARSFSQEQPEVMPASTLGQASASLTPPSQAVQVLAMLQDLSAPPLTKIAYVEDGPAKRLRKLAARAAAAVARGEVDVPLPLESRRPFGDQRAVAADALDQVRGGFSGNGLDITFGIERAVYVNGALVASTTLNLVGQGAAQLSAATSVVIQNGSGNSVATGSISQSSAGTVIQNTLDGQKIQTLTVINASANSLGFYRNINLGQSLRGAVIGSLLR